MHSSAEEKLPFFLDNCKFSFTSDRTGADRSAPSFIQKTQILLIIHQYVSHKLFETGKV
jgi:hypothetical protein